MHNLFNSLPDRLDEEQFDTLLRQDNVRIERIVSQGHHSPATGWYDQEEHEWVMVLRGSGTLQFEDESEIELKAGGYVFIPAHQRHRVLRTDPEQVTIWLAVFFTDGRQ